MMQLKVTRKLLDYLKLDPQIFDEPRPSAAALGNWFVNQVSFEGVSGFVFLSESTLYSFWLPEDGAPLEQIFLVGLAGVLGLEGFSEIAILRLLGEALPLDLSLNDDRRLSGYLNAVQSHFRFHIRREGGLDGPRLAAAISRVNRIPLKSLEWSTPAEVLREVLRLPCQ